MQGKRILLADDDGLAQAAVAKAAARYGCEIISIVRGAEVTTTVARESPDLVVLDLTFPDADGREILKELKANPGTRETPVVIWSGYDPGPNRPVFLALGADDYVEKSDPLTMLAKIKRVLLRADAPLRTRAPASTARAPSVDSDG